MVKLRRKLDSETLYLPELKQFIGRTVEITVEEHLPEVREEFYAEAARLPETEEGFQTQKAIFQNWRNDPRFEQYWPLLDQFLARSFEQMRKWASVAAQFPLEAYDEEALHDQNACDLEDARRRMS
jgi:hypothetical protein